MDTVSEPLVTIIIPCFNYGRFLDECFKNVLSQSYSNWECIIVDDGSTDNTADVAKVFLNDNRFKYIYQINSGLSAARNTGIKNSSGKYIQLLDADDLLHPDKVSKQVSFLEQHSNVDIVYGDAIFFNGNVTKDLFASRMGPTQTGLPHPTGAGETIISQLVVNNFMVVSSPLIKKLLIDRTGMFNTSYKSYEDWQYWFRAARNNANFEYLSLHGTETYIRQGHASMMSDKKRLIAAGIMIRKFMLPYLSLPLKMYNLYRLIKLYVGRVLL